MATKKEKYMMLDDLLKETDEMETLSVIQKEIIKSNLKMAYMIGQGDTYLKILEAAHKDETEN